MKWTHCNDGVIVDWLDFTLPVAENLLPSFCSLLTDLGFIVADDPRGGWIAAVPQRSDSFGSAKGAVRLHQTRGVDRVSLSGLAIEAIRSEAGGFTGLLHWLSEKPHHITRLDAALDVDIYAPQALAKLRRRVKRSKGLTKLGQRSKPVTWMLGPSAYDGRETGTAYVGNRRNHQVIARVYDKRHQLAQVHGIEAADCLRYELEVHGDRAKPWSSPCLNDVHDPTSLFWHYMGDSLLDKPSGLTPWSPSTFLTFSPEPVRSLEPYERVNRYLERSDVAQTLWKLTEGLEGGQRLNTIRHLLNTHLKQAERESLSCERTATTSETHDSESHTSPLSNLGGMGVSPMANP